MFIYIYTYSYTKNFLPEIFASVRESWRKRKIFGIDLGIFIYQLYA